MERSLGTLKSSDFFTIGLTGKPGSMYESLCHAEPGCAVPVKLDGYPVELISVATGAFKRRDYWCCTCKKRILP